jgi:hypothetical protein
MELTVLGIYLSCFNPELLKREGGIMSFRSSYRSITRDEISEHLSYYLVDFEIYYLNVKELIQTRSETDRQSLYEELLPVIYSVTRNFDLPGDRGYVRNRFQDLFGKEDIFPKFLK